MAKRKSDEFPHNKSFRSRLDAIIRGGSACHNALLNAKDFALPYCPENLRDRMAQEIKEALAAYELALDAMADCD